MDIHVITHRGAELIAQVVGGQLVIVPPPTMSSPKLLPSVQTSSVSENLSGQEANLCHKSHEIVCRNR